MVTSGQASLAACGIALVAGSWFLAELVGRMRSQGWGIAMELTLFGKVFRFGEPGAFDAGERDGAAE